MPARRRLATLALTAVAAATLPAAAQADPLVAGRAETSDGTVFTLTAGSALKGRHGKRRAAFKLDASPPPDVVNPYGDDGVVGTSNLRLAGRQLIVIGSTVGCGKPGATAIYGTAVKRARRVVATLAGGRHVRLKRRRAPRAWHFSGWVLGNVTGVKQSVTEVAAYDRKGKRITRARFEAPAACSSAAV